MPIPSKTSFTGSASSRSKVFETACAAEGAKSLQNRWEVIVCPNIVAQIGQHMADHCLQVRRDDAAAQYATSATRPRERLTLGVGHFQRTTRADLRTLGVELAM